MERSYASEKYVVHGRWVLVEWHHDPDTPAPWCRGDGHGPVSKWRSKDTKRPGERILSEAERGGRVRFYDWQAAIKKAKEEGWCTDIDTFMHLTAKHMHVPTRGMIAEHAVHRDFQSLHGWCHDEWHWCGIVVTDVETGISGSLWGIESTNEYGHHEEVISELADTIWDEVCAALLSGAYVGLTLQDRVRFKPM